MPARRRISCRARLWSARRWWRRWWRIRWRGWRNQRSRSLLRRCRYRRSPIGARSRTLSRNFRTRSQYRPRWSSRIVRLQSAVLAGRAAGLPYPALSSLCQAGDGQPQAEQQGPASHPARKARPAPRSRSCPHTSTPLHRGLPQSHPAPSALVVGLASNSSSSSHCCSPLPGHCCPCSAPRRHRSAAAAERYPPESAAEAPEPEPRPESYPSHPSSERSRLEPQEPPPGRCPHPERLPEQHPSEPWLLRSPPPTHAPSPNPRHWQCPATSPAA